MDEYIDEYTEREIRDNASCIFLMLKLAVIGCSLLVVIIGVSIWKVFEWLSTG